MKILERYVFLYLPFCTFNYHEGHGNRTKTDIHATGHWTVDMQGSSFEVEGTANEEKENSFGWVKSPSPPMAIFLV